MSNFQRDNYNMNNMQSKFSTLLVYQALTARSASRQILKIKTLTAYL